MLRKLTPLVALAALATCCALDAHAQPFPAGPGDDVTASMGVFRIKVLPKFHAWLTANVPGPFWTPGTGKLESPVLYDPTTTIQRSNPFFEGDPQDNGAVCGVANPVTISDADASVAPAGIEPLSPEVHTNVYRMDLEPIHECPAVGPHCQSPGQVSVKAGLGMGLTKCPGEVGSYGGPGFPAMSFFDVFVEVQFGPFTVYNNYPNDPLLVVNTNLLSFPPSVIYIHENSTAVPVRLRGSGSVVAPALSWVDGEKFGDLVLAGHGTDMNPCGGLAGGGGGCEAFYNQVVTAVPEMPLPAKPGTPKGCGQFNINVGESPEGGGEVTSVVLPTLVEPGFIVLLDHSTQAAEDSTNWSDVLVIRKPTGTGQQQAIFISDSERPVGPPGINSNDLAAAGVTVRDVLGGNTAYVLESGPPTVYDATNPTICASAVYNLFSDLNEATGVTPGGTGADFGIRRLIPNPTTGSTRIDFALASAARTRVEIYTVKGERVRTLVDGMRPAGSHSVSWDGHGDDGRVVAPGSYYVKLVSGEKSVSQKISLVR